MVSMETTRIKVKVGDHEFEAEGPVEIVSQQFETFKNMISIESRIMAVPGSGKSAIMLQAMDNIGSSAHVPIEKVMHVSGRVISLTALPPSIEDAALLIMLGHKDLRNNLTVTGQEIGDGLAQSGRPVPRVDRVMEKAINEAFVLKSGIKRATRYRLTNQGLSKALNVTKELIESLP
jgi:hypothetical protein